MDQEECFVSIQVRIYVSQLVFRKAKKVLASVARHLCSSNNDIGKDEQIRKTKSRLEWSATELH